MTTANKRTLAEVRAAEAARIDAELELQLVVERGNTLDQDFEQQEREAELDNPEMFYEFGRDIFFEDDSNDE